MKQIENSSMHAKYKACPHLSDADYLARMKSKCVVNDNGCWVWQAFVQKARGMEHRPNYGYGEMSYRGTQWRTHRLAWKLTHGDIPAGMVVMHTCDNTRCCNPEHVRLGTFAENSADASHKGRSDRQWQTHCGRGHEFTPENTRYRDKRNRRGRVCVTCQRMRMRGEAMQPIPRARPAA